MISKHDDLIGKFEPIIYLMYVRLAVSPKVNIDNIKILNIDKIKYWI
jgi:hypothetical protein